MTQELRKLAEAATHGEWSVKLQESPYPNWYLIYSEQVDPPLIVQVLRGSSMAGLASNPDYFTEKTPRDVAAHANAEYIAAANPAAILSLLDRLEAAEAQAKADFLELQSLGRSAKQATEAMRRYRSNMAPHDAAVVQLINQAIKRLHI